MPRIIWHGLNRNIPWIYSQLLFYVPVSLAVSIFMVLISGSPVNVSKLVLMYISVQVQVIIATLLTLLALQNYIQKHFHNGRTKLPLWLKVPDTLCGLQSYLSPELQGQVVHVKAEGQYILVQTTKGQELLRLSLTKAESLLYSQSGMRIHRSHWLHRSQMVELQFQNGNPKLLTSSMGFLPVSRTLVTKVREFIDKTY